MREKILLNILLEGGPVKRADISKKMNLSESSIRNLIRYINQDGKQNGFQVELIKGKGYILHIVEEVLFNKYLGKEQSKEFDVYDSRQRLDMMLFYILQNDGYITINELMECMCLSRITIVNELKRVEKHLAKMNLCLERKTHYGLRVSGCEQDYRRAFAKYVLGSALYLEPAKEYKKFLEDMDSKELQQVLREALEINNCFISDVAFENVIMHLKILIFRATQNNFINKELFNTMKTDAVYIPVAGYLSDWIKEKYYISLPDSEINFLAAHISAKTFTTTIDSNEKDKLVAEIKDILEQLDNEFLTSFKDDEELQDSLLLHMFPLLNRLYYSLQLENLLIEEIYTKYANVFVVSYRFGELIEEKYGFTLSKDEIGYLALHFAVHMERVKNNHLEKIKRIVVVCTTGGGSAQLLRLKLENVFTKAIVVTTSTIEISDFDMGLPDLFLSTIPMGEEYKGVPVIHIKQFLDEEEISRIKEMVTLQLSTTKKEHGILKISSLFSKQLFQRTTGENYLDILREQADKMIAEGFAASDFTELVMEREEKFSTIYLNGIAGPHPMKLSAPKDSVSVTILEKPILWQQRTVQMIFLINLKQGHLFLHKEISRLLLYLIEHDAVREELLEVLTFEQFINKLEKLM